MIEDERGKGGKKWWLVEGVQNLGDRIKDGFETIIAFYKQERSNGEKIAFENFWKTNGFQNKVADEVFN